MCDLVWQADRQQYMGRIQRTGCTGRSAGSADTVVVQQDQKGLTFYKLKTEVCIVRQTVGSVSVQSGIRNFRQNTVDQMISQFDLFCGTLFHGLCCDFCCLAVPHNTRNIFRTGTTFTLLCSAVYERTDLNAFADVKETDSLRTVQFVSAGT